MPELPEVESLRRSLEPDVVGRRIVSAAVAEPRLRRTVATDLARKVVGLEIRALRRRAKYLIVDLGSEVLLVHLGMSGSLTLRGDAFAAPSLDPRHDHAQFVLDDRTILVYNDPRRFGLLKMIAGSELDEAAELKGLGPEPLSAAFDEAYLAQRARGRKVAVKNLLMDQRTAGGIGNIYAAEILYRAGVRPTRRAGRLKRAEIANLVRFTKLILEQAIGKRGTTFRSYLDSRGEPGSFAAKLRVYGREGERCYKCSASIRNVQLGQRASFYCPRCQH